MMLFFKYLLANKKLVCAHVYHTQTATVCIHSYLCVNLMLCGSIGLNGNLDNIININSLKQKYR